VQVDARPRSLQVLILNWRDLTHPQGGGSERYAEEVAAGLVARGHRITLFCAGHARGPAEEVLPSGVRVVRSGDRMSVYPRAAWSYWRGRLGRPDVVVDVQNGVPFFARLWADRPVVVLCHHVHREQWPVVLGPRLARLGWWVESRVAPRVQRGLHYVTVSDASRRELVELGVDARRVTVVHNGTPSAPATAVTRSDQPRLIVLGRLVPHKRVELALATVAALRSRFPGLRLSVVGRGWWDEQLRRSAADLGVEDVVDFLGFVPEADKHQLLGQAWVSLVPSLKEGWGLSVMEAAAHGTPSVAFRHAGGVAESVVDGVTGTLVDSDAEFVDAVDRLLGDAGERQRLGSKARVHASEFAWEDTVTSFEAVLTEAVYGADRSG